MGSYKPTVEKGPRQSRSHHAVRDQRDCLFTSDGAKREVGSNPGGDITYRDR